MRRCPRGGPLTNKSRVGLRPATGRRIMTKNLLLMTCATGALSLMAGAAQAATATAAAADTSQSSTNVTELVVTAEKREQSLQKVPVAVSVFTGAQRDVIGINTVADVTNFAPGFTYDPGNVHA